MNYLDLLIVALVAFSIMRGLKIGLLRQILATAGFIVGLLLGSSLARLIAHDIDQAFYRFLVVALITLCMAGIFMSLGDAMAIKLRKYVDKVKIGAVDEVLGGVFEAVVVLFAVWLVASAFINLPGSELAPTFRKSFIVRQLNAAMPPPPDILANLNKVISPNTFPGVFVGQEPQHVQVPLPAGIDRATVTKAEASVVKIEGFGCGGVVEGTGFVSSKGIVVTNAHVVAGVAKPYVQSGTNRYRAKAIWFDQDLDLAVLQVANLPTAPIAMSNNVMPDGSPAVILGYPNGGGLTESPATVIDSINAVGRNIYDRGIVTRHIYELSGQVEPGNSGGPVIGADGAVYGIVFGKGVTQPGIGYALTSTPAISNIQQATAAQSYVDTGSCAAS